MRRLAVLGIGAAMLTGIGFPAPADASEGLLGAAGDPPDRVVLVSLPGVMWSDLLGDQTPSLRSLMPAVAAMSARTGARPPNVARGYITMGAGTAGFLVASDRQADEAFAAQGWFEDGPAAEAVARRTGRIPDGEIVHVGIAHVRARQDQRLYGAESGALGQALREAGISRAVVSAADHASTPERDQLRRSSVLALVDAHGSVDHGRLEGLVRPSRTGAFGVETDIDAFVEAATDALDEARVVLLDPGETWRADEYVGFVSEDLVGGVRRRALLRTEEIVRRLLPLLGPEDIVMVVSPSGPTGPSFLEHLVPMGVRALGTSDDFGTRWLTSPTTRQQGMVTLSDLAPTILELFEVPRPESMLGTPMLLGDRATNALDTMITLDRASSFRERFSASLFIQLAVLLSVVAALAFLVFLHPRRPMLPVLLGASYLTLAMFSASHIVRAFEYWRFGYLGAYVLLYGVALALAAAAWSLPGPRWTGGAGLLLLAGLMFAGDTLLGGPFQVNGIFGHSPLVAGRFYGLSNPGHTILLASGILGLAALAELRGHRRAPLWLGAGMATVVLLVGLPPFGANFGGLVTGVAAVAVVYALARGRRIRWGLVLAVGAGAGILGLGIAFLDLLREPDARTHLGRFAADIVAGDLGTIAQTIQRKATSSISSLRLTRWTYMVPVGAAVLVLMLVRRRSTLREVLARRDMLRAGTWGVLVLGAVGFAVNDSGISVPALALALAVPFLVLVSTDVLNEPPERAASPADPSHGAASPADP